MARRQRETESEKGVFLILSGKVVLEDPKPSELAITRVKSDESRMEARTYESCNTLGRVVVRSEKLNELGNSWFSPK